MMGQHLTTGLQQPADSDVEDAATSRTQPSVDGVVCRACSHVNAPGTSLCERSTCRKLLPGNALARVTSLYATNSDPALRDIEAAGSSLLEQSLSDAGGRHELAAREVSLHEYRALLHVRILKLARALDVHGEFDKRGRLRKGWIELVDRLINSAASVDRTLGLARKPKRVPSTFDEAIAMEPEAR